VTGQTDLAIFDPGSSLLRRFISDESYALLGLKASHRMI
jgi:hypothetical protein